ncbi:hypothetical protein BDL97_08G027900 [Sphagnum fallax]|nr:hypothetical protein BDL97_08G027900 [Sphagnum fallax]
MNRLQTGGIAHNMPIFSEVETSLALLRFQFLEGQAL